MDVSIQSTDLFLFVNGIQQVIDWNIFFPQTTLLQFLRAKGFTGTKLGCGEGGCGACTVMVSVFDHASKKIKHLSANACLLPLCALDGCHVTTVEGIGSVRKGMHPVQERLSSLHGSQCGFCTPGIIMSLYSKFKQSPDATPHDIEDSLDGNLCRCTGYRPIIDAAKSLSNSKHDNSKCTKTCAGCPNALKNECNEEIITSCSEHTISNLESLESVLSTKNYQEVVLPSVLYNYSHRPLKIVSRGVTWLQPIDLLSLLAMKVQHPQAKLVVGNTEIGIEVKFKLMKYPVLIYPSHVAELNTLEIEEGPSGKGLRIGASVSINKIKEFILSLSNGTSTSPSNALPSSALQGLLAIKDMISWFASNQIRNVACIGGNIVTASPISDLNPMLVSLGAILRIMSQNPLTNSTPTTTSTPPSSTTTTTNNIPGIYTRTVPIKTFFKGYRKVDLHPEEILESIFIPLTSQYEYVLPFKQARRREDDISIVTAGIRIALQPSLSTNEWLIREVDLAYGGMAATTISTPNTSNYLLNKSWNQNTLGLAMNILRKELALDPNVPGGQAEYRVALAVSALFRAYFKMTLDLATDISLLDSSGATTTTLPPVPTITEREKSGAYGFVTQNKTESRGQQRYSIRKGGLNPAPIDLSISGGKSTDPEDRGSVGESIMHKSAALQVTGEALYTDDMPCTANTVFGALVMSTKAHAKILSIDDTQARLCRGFQGFYSAKDVVGCNKIGAVVKDEEVFATSIVKHVGAVIGIVVATTHEDAVAAAQKVVVEYEDLVPIISIADAIAAQSYFSEHHNITSGNIELAESTSDIIVEGEMHIGGQEHFYLETNCSLIVPSEDGLMEVYSSTQNPTKAQNFCASVCGLPAARVVSHCKRMGGAFGGKETRSVFITCAAAVAAQHLQRPVRINIERDTDMSITGQRHAFYCKYKAGCTSTGQLKFLTAHLYSNGGFSLDLSQPVIDRALFHCDNCYSWNAINVTGSICKTNQPSHTAYRGFGGPQGLMVAETALEHLANVANIDPQQMRTQNLYQEGQRTHFRQLLTEFYVPRLWSQILVDAEVDRRREEVVAFNRENKWKKRGIAVLPTKFGISFTAKFMNQGGALVHVYTDGSVLVSHGGTEMGQGLHTKIIQIAARAFNIPDTMVHIVDTTTNTVANSSPTAASMSADMYGMATLDACHQILERLKPIAATSPECTWKDLIYKAYFQRIDLSAHGFFIVPHERCGYNWALSSEENANTGQPFNYFTQGVACSEVEVDVLTGDHKVLRSDIMMDLGKSINPALDIGQVEGAFIQGMGWCTMEELVWGDSDHKWVRPGHLFTKGPGTYKIPAFNDVPVDLRVYLLDTVNSFAVHSSKAVGEPPFFLGVSVFLAIRQAIQAARTENGISDFYQLQLPATSERIRMACSDHIAMECTIRNPQYQPKGSF